MPRSKHLLLPLLFAAGMIAGCGTDALYWLYAAQGAVSSVLRARPIEAVLADGSVTPEQAAKLELVLRLRRFAAERIGLNVGEAYSLFDDNGDGPVAYAVSGAFRDRLEPYVYLYPLIGAYDARGFFARDLAEQERRRLEQEGYDAFIGDVEGFSTLGLLPDPIRSSNLRLDDLALAEFLMHELTHRSVFKPDDTDFNESMATFVGRAAAQRYFDETFGVDSAEALAARLRYADLELIDRFVDGLVAHMADFYGQPITSEEKLAMRAAVFAEGLARFATDFQPLLNDPERYAVVSEMTLNNAVLLAARRYVGGLNLYRQVFERLGTDFGPFLDLLRQAAQASDSRAFLAEWLAGPA